MDGMPFDAPKPPKDWDERIAFLKTDLLKKSGTLGAKVQEHGSTAGVHLQVFGG